MSTRILALLLFFIFFLSCEEETLSPDNLEVGYEYYPLEVGKYITYQVDSIIFDPIDNQIVRDTISKQVKEEIVSNFEGEDGLTIYAMERSERKQEGDIWQVRDVYSTYRSDEKAVRVEENLTFIKMLFPLSRGKSWEGLGFDKLETTIDVVGEEIEVFKNWESVVTDVEGTLETGRFTFDNLVTIELARDTNSIELRSVFERYAKGIGLVYRELSILNTQNIAVEDTVLWENKAQTGFLMYQTIIDHN